MKIFTENFNMLTSGDLFETISDKTGFTEEYVELLIKGAAHPSLIELCHIADAYGVTTDYLLGRTEEKEPAPAAAGQAQTAQNCNKIDNDSIAQSEEIVKNFTEFLPILMDFARQRFSDIQVIQVSAHDYVDGDKLAKVTFADGEGNKYCLLLEGGLA